MRAPEVTAINVMRRLALLNDGRVVPITNLFDRNGDETNDPAQATGFAAGEGRDWFAGRVKDYPRVTVH